MAENFDVEFIDDEDRDDRNARFVVHGLTPAFANGIRRAMLADVPTVAVEHVRVIENTSVMFDEMIGLRLGLIPMTTPVEEFEPGQGVTLALDVEGPSTAYSGDIESTDDLVQPAEENVPIIELKEDQRLAFEAEAVLGRGRDHAKHQGGVAVGYRHLQRVQVEGELDEYGDREPRIVRGVIDDDGELVPAKTFGNDITNRYPEQAVTVEGVPGAFVFHVETDGSMSVNELVTGAVRSLADRADELEAAVQL